MSYGYGTKTTAYLEADILSRPKEWLIPLLYEHLLSSLRRAAVQIEAGDHEGRGQSLEKAGAIVLELSSSLNNELGGEVARQMTSLYAFFLTEIMQIGLTRDVNRLRKLAEIVAELTEAWIEAAEQVAPRGGAPRAVTASAA